jgi:hypothetical protein
MGRRVAGRAGRNGTGRRVAGRRRQARREGWNGARAPGARREGSNGAPIGEGFKRAVYGAEQQRWSTHHQNKSSGGVRRPQFRQRLACCFERKTPGPGTNAMSSGQIKGLAQLLP